jgi:protein involved in polysaccharide export with SLBB domain
MSQSKFVAQCSWVVCACLLSVAGLAGAQQLPQPTAGATGGVGAGGAAGFSMGGISTGGVPSIRQVDPLNPQQSANNTAAGFVQAPEPLKPNDFQKFVLETAGYKLPLYGQAFFDNLQFSQLRAQQLQQAQSASAPVGAGFAPVDNAPVSNDYLLGPGDQVLIRGWGSLDIDVRTLIDRNGMVSLPRVGSVSLAGVKASQAEGVLRNAVGKFYKDFQLSVTLGQLRSITVYVVGQARRPGSYSLSSVSSLASGLLATGGPNASGSMRRVQLKRAGQVVAEFDLYSFLSRGDSAGDIKLTDGDVIVIPPAVGYVALVGKVNNPAVYELKAVDETLDQLLAVAGGLPVVADPRRVTLERLTPSSSQPRSVQDFALNEQGLKTPLKNGDLLTVLAISPELGNAVTLRGNVAQPARLAWREGMRVRDIIPNREALISRDSVRRQNEVLFDASQRERTQREREMIPEDLLADKELDDRLMRDPRYVARSAAATANANMPGNKPNDQNGNNPQNASPDAVRNNNLRTARPDIYDLESYRDQRQARLFAQQAPIQAKDKNEVPSVAELIGNLYDEINWDYAVIERINRQDLSVSLLPFNLGRVLNDAKDPDNHLLQAGDVLTVFSVNDMRVPIAKRRIMVRIEGEVAQPGIYQAKPGESLSSVLQRAGGLTHDAYLFGSGLYREEVRKSQVENLQKLMRRLETESSAQISQLSQSMGASADAALAQTRVLAAQNAQRQALERVRSVRPEGRIALGLEPDLYNYINKLPDIRVQNGDRWVIPSRPDFVYIYGAVNTESALIYRPGQTVADYLKLAGVGVAADRSAVIVVRADGSAFTTDPSSWFSASVGNLKLMPGDSIVVPDKVDMESTWSSAIRNTKDITQIFYQLGLGAAGLKALGY